MSVSTDFAIKDRFSHNKYWEGNGVPSDISQAYCFAYCPSYPQQIRWRWMITSQYNILLIAVLSFLVSG